MYTKILDFYFLFFYTEYTKHQKKQEYLEMNLLLSDILKLEIFNDCKIIAGKSCLGNEVSFATVMDVPDIVEWLHGGEILLAAKLFDSCANASFFVSLKEKSVSAIITKPNYVLRLEQPLIDLCETICLTIIVVPNETTWGDILNPITQLIAEIQYQAIYQSQLFHASLMSFMIGGDSLEWLCNDIYEKFQMSIALTDSNFALLSSSSDIVWENVFDMFSLTQASYTAVLGTNIKSKGIPGYIYTNDYMQSMDKKAFIFPVVQNHISYGYIFYLVPSGHKGLNPSESMKIDQISLVLALDNVKQQELNNAVRRFNNLYLDKIMHTDSISQYERAKIEHSLNCHLHENYYIALANRMDGKEDIYTQSMNVSRLFRRIAGDSGYFNDILCFERATYLVFFVPADCADIQKYIDRLYEVCKKYTATTKIGISETTHNQFLRAYNQAFQTLQYIETYGRKHCSFYSELGILRFFMDKSGSLDMDFLLEMQKKYLIPLEQYDENKNSQLKETMIKYVLSNCNPSRTLQELYIHKNTLYARLKKIEKLLNISFSSNDDLLNIQLVIKADQLHILDKTNRILAET